MGWVRSTHVGIHFVSSLPLDVFGQHTLRYFLCPCWHGTGVLNTGRDTFCVLAFMGGFWSIQVEIHVVSSLLWADCGNSKLRYILCPHWYGMGLVNTNWNGFCALAGLTLDRSTNVEMHFALVLEVFVQHMFRFILYSRWYWMVFVNTSFDALCIVAGMGGIWLTHGEIQFEYSLAWNGFCQHRLKYSLFLR